MGIDYATLTRYVEQIMLKAIDADNDLRGRAWPHDTRAWVVIQQRPHGAFRDTMLASECADQEVDV